MSTEEPVVDAPVEGENASSSSPDAKRESPKNAEGAPRPVRPFIPHKEMPEMTTAKKIMYCPDSGLPADYCEYSDKWEISKPWVLANYPEYYPELANLSIDDLKKNAESARATASKKQSEKELPGGKKTKEKTAKIVIKVEKRQGKKKTTTIVGLDLFGVKLDAAAKIFKKKFACGSAAVKGNPGQPDCVEIQGDPGKSDLTALIQKEFPDVSLKGMEWTG